MLVKPEIRFQLTPPEVGAQVIMANAIPNPKERAICIKPPKLGTPTSFAASAYVARVNAVTAATPGST